MKELTMKSIRKMLIASKIRLSDHAMKRMEKRGYTKKDVLACIWNGERTSMQMHQGQMKAVIEGKDTDGLPIALVIGKDFKNSTDLAVVTVFPPIDRDRFLRVI